MKILHTSDLHLGHRLLEQSQYEEQHLFLQWLLTAITEENVHVLLIAGDIFDNGAPSAQSLKLYYDFLVDLRQTPCQHVFVTGGNHDAPGMLEAPKELLQALSVQVVGKATDNPENEVFRIEEDDEQLVVAAVPFLRDQDIRRALGGENYDEVSEKYKKALISHYREMADCCRKATASNVPVIAMGHLFAVGGKASDSEQSIYVGGLGDIAAGDFPKIFDYIALGHLHGPQTVQGYETIRYSGSPYILSFSEINQPKSVVFIETDQTSVTTIRLLPVPCFRPVRSIQGTVGECQAAMQRLSEEKHALTPWIEVILNDEQDKLVSASDINKLAEPLHVEVLKVSYGQPKTIQGIEQLLDEGIQVSELNPEQVFRKKCDEEGYNLVERPDLLEAFNEILQQLNEEK
ncbi:MAG: exonuclease SbcCD subunit D C-terminal domain-containing protein [Bacteroidota bacterium]|nr:exonuclease SbcCD subunit D C-terminal domain-containing protein [Bacteroidota bacterium]